MGYGKPAWLDALYNEKFFINCQDHELAKKNEKNVLCLDCCISICPHCLPVHRLHRLIQIRRYVYHEVIRLEDLDKVIDCSNVQAYTINSAKVIFIKKRPQNRQFKGAGNYCTSCDRILQEPYIHCSLGCKVDFVLTHNRDLSPYLRRCKVLQLGPDFLYPQELGEDQYDYTYMTPNEGSTIVDCEEPMASSWISSDCSLPLENMMSISDNDMTCESTDQIVRKKRSGLYICGRSSHKVVVSDEDMATSCMSRRKKGIPHRSPLC